MSSSSMKSGVPKGLFIASLIANAVLGCHPSSSETGRVNHSINTGTSAGLSGTWTGSSPGLKLSVDLKQAGDTVTGNGTFTVTLGPTIGCGGESLIGGGRVTISGLVSGDSFQGRFSFGTMAEGWTPPYVAAIKPDSLVGRFMSVDRSGCPLTLIRKR